MSKAKIYTTSPNDISQNSFYPRNYDPVYLFVKEKLQEENNLRSFLTEDVTGGTTPPQYLFRDSSEKGIPYVKTSAITRDFINMNDLHYIQEDFHYNKLSRAITYPYDVIFTMTGKFMGKAALCPPTVEEMNMSQNSVVLRTESPEVSAFLTIYLNSEINKKQIDGIYSITKQKYLNQTKISNLGVINYKDEYQKDALDYLDGIKSYYETLQGIKETIHEFNEELNLNELNTKGKRSYKISNRAITPQMLNVTYYEGVIGEEKSEAPTKKRALKKLDIEKGDEVGSKNYLREGIPFVRTSDIMNFGVDYHTNHYCSPAVYEECSQNLKKGDLVFTKDGKIGEVALLQESAKIVVASGIVKIRPKDINDKYWLFLLLSSKLGKKYFNKWSVIASTMAHLRKDFFEDFNFFDYQEHNYSAYPNKIKELFSNKEKAFSQVQTAKRSLIDRFNFYKKLD